MNIPWKTKKKISVVCGRALGLLLLVTGTVLAQPIPIGHWTFDEASSGTGTGIVLDSAVGANDGIIKGGNSNGPAEYTPGVVGIGALSFNGDDHVDFGLVPDLDLTGGSYTVAFWLKYNESQLGRIINMDDAGNCSGGYSVFLSGTIRATHNNGNCNDTGQFFPAPAFGDFVHVAVVYDSTAQTITTYYDGVSQGTFSKSPSITTLATDGNDPLLFGTYNASNSQGLKGTLDDVRLYNVPLSKAQIDQLITPVPTVNIALFGSETGPRLTNIVNNITAAATGIATVDNRTGCAMATPTLTDLQQYDAVFVWSDCIFANRGTLGNVLADYADAGGRIVLAAHVWWSGGTYPLNITGRFASGGYNPLRDGSSGISICGSPTGWSLDRVNNDASYDGLFTDVNNFTVCGIDNSPGITTGSTLIARTSPNQFYPLVAIKDNVVALNFFPVQVGAQGGSYTGDGARLIVNALTFDPTPLNLPPTANAGDNQSIRAGDTVNLDGNASFDDNTASPSLGYAWSFSSFASATAPILTGANTATPSFLADTAGTYVLDLIVTDESSLASIADQVEVSSDNLAPTSSAGNDQLVIIGTQALLDGSGSSDPEGDTLTYNWTILSAPAGSTSTILSPTDGTTGLTPSAEGVYEVELLVSDFLGAGTPDTVEITATNAANYAQLQLLDAHQVVVALTQSQVTKRGNKKALEKQLRKVVKHLQKGKLNKAIKALNNAMQRTDGCTLRGEPDANGKKSHFERDWIIDCSAQVEAYAILNSALNALTAP